MTRTLRCALVALLLAACSQTHEAPCDPLELSACPPDLLCYRGPDAPDGSMSWACRSACPDGVIAPQLCDAEHVCFGGRCYPFGHLTLGESCTRTLDCGEGLACTRDAGALPGQQVCAPACDAQSPDPDASCSSGEVCHLLWNVCVSPCRPEDPGTCASGHVCRGNVCWRSELAALCWDAEGATFDCEPGMLCHFMALAHEDGECVDPVEWARRNP